MTNGEPIPTALVRIPPADDHRGNISVGAKTLCRPLTTEELRVCDAVGPLLREKGLLFAGIDVIGGFLTEINVTSPTGIRELESTGSFEIPRMLLDAIEGRIHSRSAVVGGSDQEAHGERARDQDEGLVHRGTTSRRWSGIRPQTRWG